LKEYALSKSQVWRELLEKEVNVKDLKLVADDVFLYILDQAVNEVVRIELESAHT